MKKIIILFIAIAFSSCNSQVLNDYVTIEGKIENKNNEILTILGKEFKKEIKVNADGSFKDTLKVTNGFHGYTDGKVQSFIYLKNGYDLKLKFDPLDFPGSVTFSGNGAETNQYLLGKLKFITDQDLNNSKLIFELERAEFDTRMAFISKSFDDMIANAKNLDPEVLKMETENNKKLVEFFNTNYEKEHGLTTALKKGAPSPKFNYPNTKGENISLDDLKGKYVYIDVWATWCGPCKREIPFLKELNSEYQNKNLAIVSLSIDKAEHKEKWLKMVEEEDLKGIQIMADKDWSSEFVTSYNITGIPRFILIDNEGNILDANAPRPSDPRLKEVFSDLNL